MTGAPGGEVRAVGAAADALEPRSGPSVLVSTAIAIMVSGCAVEAVRLDGKACPCADGYQCELATNTCVAGDGCAPQIQVSNLRPIWTTPNQIRWQWDTVGQPEALLEYQLVIGPSEADVTSRSAAATVFTAAENPELNKFVLPRVGCGDTTTVTTSDGLSPAATYFGQITVTDTSGCTGATNVAGATTGDLAVSGNVTLFEDALPIGYWIGVGPASACATYDLSSQAPYLGTHHMEFVSQACDVEPWEDIHLGGLAADLSAMSASDFATAYVEFAIALDAQVPTYCANFYLNFGTGTPSGYFFPWSLRGDAVYRVLQVPLRALVLDDAGTRLSFEASQAGIESFNFGAGWTHPSTVRIDEVRVRW